MNGALPARYGARTAGRSTAAAGGRFLPALPAVGKLLVGVVVRDTAALQRSPGVRDALPGRWTKRRCLSYLSYRPPASPAVNASEPVLRVGKQAALPEHRSPTVAALRAAVDAAFTSHEARMGLNHLPPPRRAA